MEDQLRDCGRGLHRRIFFLPASRFGLLEKRMKLAHHEARNESSYCSCEDTSVEMRLWIGSHVRLPASISGATLAASDKNKLATRCTSNCSTSRQPAEANELQRSGSRYIRTMPSASASGLPGSTRIPLRTTSG